MRLAWSIAAFAACMPVDRDAEPPAEGEAPPVVASPAADDPVEEAIEAHWRQAEVRPVGPASDAEFLRRVSLDLVGRIPTPQETEAFLASEAPDRRAALVDRLLASDAWAEHWSEVLGDTLLQGSTLQRPRLREAFEDWLEQELHGQPRWDGLTTQMLTAEGPLDGASGFVFAHARGGRVEGLTGQTARVFLGLQLQCAQCHDDPEDRFTQQEFYGLAAYYARTRLRATTIDGQRVRTIVERPRGEMRMPTEHDDPGDRSGPRVSPAFVALDATPVGDETRRQALARGVVGSPLFAEASVNHAWARLFGRGIVDPWDDLGDPRAHEPPALLEVLARDFEAHGYDLRHLLRTIVLSSAYQQSSRGEAEGAAARERAFAQAAVRPMSAPQLVRSLLVATGLDDTRGRAFRRQVELRRQQIAKEFAVIFDDDEMASATGFQGNVPQALLLLNGELTNQGVGAPQGALAEVLATESEPAARVEALFLRIYGRSPEPARRDALVAFLEARDHAPAAYEDLVHSMLVSSEFLTIH